jgi:CHAT domain-containing protein
MDIAGWLWDVLLGPVDSHLRNVAKLAADAPVVLLPPGLLGLLPLHAATPRTGGGLSFGERWTVSYAPSARALLACRKKAEASHQPRKLLAIIDPPGQARLLGAREEAKVLRRYFGEPDRVLLEDARATLPQVLRHLPTATYIHASTHGAHHPVLPQRSGLHLADDPLELGRLRDAQLAAARLVYLSACESGLAGVWRMPEEFIGLPAGFVQAGAAGVVGSLWPVFDDTAFLIAKRFYELHLDDGGAEILAPAHALRQAQHWLRTVTFGTLRAQYPVRRGADGEYLFLCDQSDSSDDDYTAALALRLGADDEQPYNNPHEYAAFTFTGA